MMQKRVYFLDSKGIGFAVPVANVPRIRTETVGRPFKIDFPAPIKVSYEYNPPKSWRPISRKAYRNLAKNGRVRK